MMIRLLLKPKMAFAANKGNKTNTRRVVTFRNSWVNGKACSKKDWAKLDFERARIVYSPTDEPMAQLAVPKKEDVAWFTVIPRIQPGDNIRFMETWAVKKEFDCLKPSRIPAGAEVWYKADEDEKSPCSARGKWRESIYMPYRACRLCKKVKKTLVQRIQGIKEADAVAEGTTGRYEFSRLWNEINEKSGHGWEVNDWVWGYGW